MADPKAVLSEKTDRFSTWLEQKALPMWMSAGLDPAGGFFERIGQDGTPMASDNRRARVQPRQVYCYVAAGMRGFHAPWQDAARSGLAYFETVYRRADGLFGALANPQGEMVDDSFDLYNQAFALFAYAQYGLAFPNRMGAMELAANTLLDRLTERFKHPDAGFEEANPRKLPLCSNPHMHMFEAALAWEAAASAPERWRALADEIAELAMTRFIDPDSGGLREFFDDSWNPHPGDEGRVMEPGHQFEWAWLLSRWGALRGHADALSKARRMFEIGETHGLSPDGKVAIMSLNDDFSVRDPIARMWPQTEWLKAALRLALLTKGEEKARYLGSAIRASEAIDLFLDTPLAGLWYDKRRPDGEFVVEPAPASTFYHIVCAIHEASDIVTAL